VGEKKNEAIAQILRYNTSNELKSISNLKKWVIVLQGINVLLMLRFDFSERFMAAAQIQSKGEKINGA